jgi:hypothetical protein
MNTIMMEQLSHIPTVCMVRFSEEAIQQLCDSVTPSNSKCLSAPREAYSCRIQEKEKQQTQLTTERINQ